MQFNNILEMYNSSAYDITQASANSWRKRNLVEELIDAPCIDSDKSGPELHRPANRRRQTVSCGSRLMHTRQKPCRTRGLSLLTRPGRTSSSQCEATLVQSLIVPKTRSMTRQASILDLPNELLSQILTSGASSDWFYCLDHELFRAFRDTHPHLRQFALNELMRLYPQMLDDATKSLGSEPSTPTQDSPQFSNWKSSLLEAVENPTSRTTWNLMRYDPFHPTQFFNTAVAGCPTTLYVKKIPLFAEDVYFTLSLGNDLPHFPSTATPQRKLSPHPDSWSRLKDIFLGCQITDTVASYILSCSRRTLEVAAFNLKAPISCSTPVHHSFAINTASNGSICMDVLHSLTVDTSASLKNLFDSVALPSLQNLELVSYPKCGIFRSYHHTDHHPNTPILNPGLNIPWKIVKQLLLRSYENLSTNFDDIVSQCTLVEHVELTGVRTSTSYSLPSFVKSVKAY